MTKSPCPIWGFVTEQQPLQLGDTLGLFVEIVNPTTIIQNSRFKEQNVGIPLGY
jgi:hypothetical protein